MENFHTCLIIWFNPVVIHLLLKSSLANKTAMASKSSNLRQQLAQEFDYFFMISGEVVKLDAVLEHALVF